MDHASEDSNSSVASGNEEDAVPPEPEIIQGPSPAQLERSRYLSLIPNDAEKLYGYTQTIRVEDWEVHTLSWMNFVGIPPHHRVGIAVFLLSGQAAYFWRNLQLDHERVSWPRFITLLRERFAFNDRVTDWRRRVTFFQQQSGEMVIDYHRRFMNELVPFRPWPLNAGELRGLFLEGLSYACMPPSYVLQEASFREMVDRIVDYDLRRRGMRPLAPPNMPHNPPPAQGNAPANPADEESEEEDPDEPSEYHLEGEDEDSAGEAEDSGSEFDSGEDGPDDPNDADYVP